MRISDWSSDVCSSDLVPPMCRALLYLGQPTPLGWLLLEPDNSLVRQALTPQMLHMLNIAGDRKRVVSGKSVSVRVDLGVRRIINKQKPSPRCTYQRLLPNTTIITIYTSNQTRY